MPIAYPLADFPAPGDPRKILGLERTLVISYEWFSSSDPWGTLIVTMIREILLTFLGKGHMCLS